MATLREIKRRIESVKSTQQITRAMKMVSAAKLRKSQQLLSQTRPYADELDQIISFLSSRHKINNHPLFQTREPHKVCYVLVTAEKGLCGGFNAHLIRTANEYLLSTKAKESCLITIGRKGYEFYKSRHLPISGYFIDFLNKFEFKNAKNIAFALQKRFIERKYDQIFFIYNEFKSIIKQDVVVKQFLPVVAKEEVIHDSPITVVFDPHPEVILDKLLPMSLNYAVYRILLESITAEHAARMTAMEAASDNAQEMIKDLLLFYNKARQAAITKELNEIVSGAEALKG